MLQDPFAGSGLRSVEPGDRTQINSYLSTLAEPLSDYTFSQIFTWRNSMRLLWREIDGHLCVFANGAGDLTLLLPPIGSARSDNALRNAFELMNDYNAAHGVDPRDHSRVEYISEELLERFSRDDLVVEPMGHDYVYPTQSMIDLAGGDLKSKRQDRNRFTRDHRYLVEPYDVAAHRDECLTLLKRWDVHRESTMTSIAQSSGCCSTIKRQKEMLAVELTLEHAAELHLKGLVVRAASIAGANEKTSPLPIVAFTFGELLGRDQCSIVIEKTDLSIKGLAQFIFSEFCRRDWSDRPRVNAGDDWGLPSLAWTKNSYRPSALLKKFSVHQTAVTQVLAPSIPQTLGATPIRIRTARAADLAAAAGLERECFETYQLSIRQLRYLQARLHSTTSFMVAATDDDQIVGQGIALLRHTRRGLVGRIYSLAVAESYRGQRLGRQLLDTLLNDLTRRGATRVHLEVDLRSAAAIRLYESMRFQRVEALPDYYGDGRDGIRMSREIQAIPKPRATAA